MKYLLDTNAFLWALEGDPRLGKEEVDIIDDLRNEIFVSVVSLWEIEIKKEKYPKSFPYDVKKLLSYLQGAGYRLLGLSAEDIVSLSGLNDKNPALPHKDPFDRLLLAQAKNAGMIFISHDCKFLDFEERCIHLF